MCVEGETRCAGCLCTSSTVPNLLFLEPHPAHRKDVVREGDHLYIVDGPEVAEREGSVRTHVKEVVTV